jgi:hypothetical protein
MLDLYKFNSSLICLINYLNENNILLCPGNISNSSKII